MLNISDVAIYNSLRFEHEILPNSKYITQAMFASKVDAYYDDVARK